MLVLALALLLVLVLVLVLVVAWVLVRVGLLFVVAMTAVVVTKEKGRRSLAPVPPSAPTACPRPWPRQLRAPARRAPAPAIEAP